MRFAGQDSQDMLEQIIATNQPKVSVSGGVVFSGKAYDILGLPKEIADSVQELDPTSADFGKFKFLVGFDSP